VEHRSPFISRDYENTNRVFSGNIRREIYFRIIGKGRMDVVKKEKEGRKK
jgi:hypothetical protein